MLTIYRRDNNGKLVEVATVENQAAADRFIKRMQRMWSAEYVVREEDRVDKKNAH